MTLSLFCVSFVQQTVKHLLWRLADSTTDKKPGMLWFPCFGILFKRLGPKMDGSYLHIIVHFSRRGKKHMGDVVHTPHSKARFLQVSKFTCVSVPGVVCFKAFPLSCLSLASEDLGVEHFFCFPALHCGHCLCKLLMFPVILIFPAAPCLLQCLADCSEQW